MVTLEQVKQAAERVKEVAHETPLDFSTTFSELANHPVYLKLENLQKTGSFKVRGAYNKIVALGAREREKGVIAASAGNHAQGVAFSSARAGIASTIVMPEGATIAKITATKNYGAKVILHGETFDEALAYAHQLQRETQGTFIHAFDDPLIIAGQGTVGLEILAQLPDVEAIVCPIGGGGLISGIAIAVKESKPSVKLYGVQAAACPGMVASLANQAPVKVRSSGTLADGIAVKQPGKLTFAITQKYLDDVITVEDIEIARTMLYLLERSKLLVEGSGAASLAALLYRKLPLAGKKTVALISGGNVDVNLVSRIIERGLVESGRYVTIRTTVPDKPGYLNRLLTIIAELRANVISIVHHRISSRIMPGQTEIELSLETQDHAHIEKIERRLLKAGYELTKEV
ncbi:threonine ammonia-lyase [Bacillaceae bacterium]